MTAQPSVCDRCSDPGLCCREITLSYSPPGTTKLEALAWLASCEPAAGEIGLPFIPLTFGPPPWRETEPCPVMFQRIYTCINLGADGRCMDYQGRPKLCRTFIAGGDMPCAMYGKACPELDHQPRAADAPALAAE